MSANHEESISEKLGQPFPASALKQRTAGGGKALTYIEGHTCINRLNAATGNHWDFRIVGIESRDVPVSRNGQTRTDLLMMATVELTIPGLGARQHVGVQLVSPGSGEDLVKGCVTDALKKAATLFGVGIELYGPDYGSDDAAPLQADGPVARTMPPQAPRMAPAASSPPVRHSAPQANGARSWSDFWAYARVKGISNMGDVEKAFGHSLGDDPGAAYAELAELSGDQ